MSEVEELQKMREEVAHNQRLVTELEKAEECAARTICARVHSIPLATDPRFHNVNGIFYDMDAYLKAVEEFNKLPSEARLITVADSQYMQIENNIDRYCIVDPACVLGSVYIDVENRQVKFAAWDHKYEQYKDMLEGEDRMYAGLRGIGKTNEETGKFEFERIVCIDLVEAKNWEEKDGEIVQLLHYLDDPRFVKAYKILGSLKDEEQ